MPNVCHLQRSDKSMLSTFALTQPFVLSTLVSLISYRAASAKFNRIQSFMCNIAVTSVSYPRVTLCYNSSNALSIIYSRYARVSIFSLTFIEIFLPICPRKAVLSLENDNWTETSFNFIPRAWLTTRKLLEYLSHLEQSVWNERPVNDSADRITFVR